MATRLKIKEIAEARGCKFAHFMGGNLLIAWAMRYTVLPLIRKPQVA
jgi:hypothetical protein